MSDHGTRTKYNHGSCRCAECREANRTYQAAQNRRRAARLVAGEATPPHGSYTTYENWSCRCEPCKQAMSIENARRRRNREARKATR